MGAAGLGRRSEPGVAEVPEPAVRPAVRAGPAARGKRDRVARHRSPQSANVTEGRGTIGPLFQGILFAENFLPESIERLADWPAIREARQYSFPPTLQLGRIASQLRFVLIPRNPSRSSQPESAASPTHSAAVSRRCAR